MNINFLISRHYCFIPDIPFPWGYLIAFLFFFVFYKTPILVISLLILERRLKFFSTNEQTHILQSSPKHVNLLLRFSNTDFKQFSRTYQILSLISAAVLFNSMSRYTDITSYPSVLYLNPTFPISWLPSILLFGNCTLFVHQNFIRDKSELPLSSLISIVPWMLWNCTFPVSLYFL